MPDLDEDLDDAPSNTRATASSTRVQSTSMNALQWVASAPFRWAGKLFNTVGTIKGERRSPQVANPKLQFSIFGKQSVGKDMPKPVQSKVHKAIRLSEIDDDEDDFRKYEM